MTAEAFVGAIFDRVLEKAIAKRDQLAALVAPKRAEEREGVAWAIANKTSYSDSAWKERHQAEVRLRAASAFVDAIADAAAEGRR